MSDMEYMRRAGKLAAQTLDHVQAFIKPGITTEMLDDICHEFIVIHDAIPAPLNYKGFPKSICTSVNHVACHGIPGPKKLNDGDIINVDVTVILDGWHGDTSRMFYVGKPKIKAKRLIEATYEAMMAGIEIIKPGATTGDIGHAIEQVANKNKLGIARSYCGHGIGKIFHDEPQVPFYGNLGEGTVLKEGMFITVEPILNLGKDDTKVLDDNWTVVTRDRSLSAQWEHTVAVIEDGYEILTLSE